MPKHVNIDDDSSNDDNDDYDDDDDGDCEDKRDQKIFKVTSVLIFNKWPTIKCQPTDLFVFMCEMWILKGVILKCSSFSFKRENETHWKKNKIILKFAMKTVAGM